MHSFLSRLVWDSTLGPLRDDSKLDMSLMRTIYMVPVGVRKILQCLVGTPASLHNKMIKKVNG